LLIYDHNKNFVGIDDEDLRILGFTKVDELLAVCEDLADLFVKKPGYLHNFKNFEWIDFVLHSESDNSKAIVNSGKRSFSCDIVIKPFYMLQTPQNEAYAIYLQHIKAVDAAELAALGVSAPEPKAATAEPVAVKPAPKIEPVAAAVPKPAAPVMPEPVVPVRTPEPAPILDDLPSFDDIPSTPLEEPESFDLPTVDDPYAGGADLHPDFNKPLEIEDDLFLDETPAASAPEFEIPEPSFEIPEMPAAHKTEERPMLGDYTSHEQECLEQMQDYKEYVYDPNIAANELGLPVDLIEEFIGDFIAQSHDFKDELYEAIGKSDFDNIKLLSHKLKGVAANLRIEDSFKLLSVVNTSHDIDEVSAYMKMFYRTIDKLEGKGASDIYAMPEAASQTAAPVAVAAAMIPEEPVVPVLPSEEEDLYAFETQELSAPATEPAVPPSTEDDDLYTFDLAPEPLAPSEKPETLASDDDDLYAFDFKDTALSAADTAPVSDDDDLYAFDTLPETPAADTFASKPAFADDEDDLYAFDIAPVSDTASASLPESPFETGSFIDDDPFASAMPAAKQPENAEPDFMADFERDDDLFGAPSAAPEPAAAPTPVSHYDATSAANELGLPVTIVEELKGDFVVHAKEIRPLLEEALKDGQSNIWRMQALQMKGVADNLRMNEISAVLKTLESANDAQNARTAVAELYAHVGQL